MRSRNRYYSFLILQLDLDEFIESNDFIRLAHQSSVISKNILKIKSKIDIFLRRLKTIQKDYDLLQQKNDFREEAIKITKSTDQIDKEISQKELINLVNHSYNEGYFFLEKAYESIHQTYQYLLEQLKNNNNHFSIPAYARNVLDAIQLACNVTEALLQGKYRNIKISKTKQLYGFAEQLNVRYMPLSQIQNCLTGGKKQQKKITLDSGQCSGYVTRWISDVSKYGRAKIRFFSDKKIQQAQTYPYDDAYRELVRFDFYYRNDETHIECIKKVIKAIQTGYLYYLSLRWFKKASGHAIGVRKIESGKYELMDPNYGIFLIKNRHTCERFLHALSLTYHNSWLRISDHGQFTLKQSIMQCNGKQRPSVPVLCQNKNNVYEIDDSKDLNLGSFRENCRTLNFYEKAEPLKFLVNRCDVSLNDSLIYHKVHDEEQFSAKMQQSLINTLDVVYNLSPSQLHVSLDREIASESRKEKMEFTLTVCEKITNEINIFSSKRKDKYLKDMISALQVLHNKILRSAQNKKTNLLQLKGIISLWLYEETNGISHYDLMQRTNKNTADFIEKLSQENEIHPFYLNRKRLSLLNHIFGTLFGPILKDEMSNVAVSMRCLIRDSIREKSTPKQILNIIKEYSNKHLFIGNKFIYFFKHSKNEIVFNDILRILRQIDPDCPSQMTKLHNELNSYFKENENTYKQQMKTTRS